MFRSYLLDLITGFILVVGGCSGFYLSLLASHPYSSSIYLRRKRKFLAEKNLSLESLAVLANGANLNLSNVATKILVNRLAESLTLLEHSLISDDRNERLKVLKLVLFCVQFNPSVRYKLVAYSFLLALTTSLLNALDDNISASVSRSMSGETEALQILNYIMLSGEKARELALSAGIIYYIRRYDISESDPRELGQTELDRALIDVIRRLGEIEEGRRALEDAQLLPSDINTDISLLEAANEGEE
ncbi:hypothetical protein NEOLI_002324 [Neolecta irregularis DAH-3]|uniref:Uncharacterized protein n=1 Tax=Neolecta irregularis (strain DAH-3) TaxID=1198029 RepID=A0A1U7LV02_NEOID|nr:hypothetical protein NEOLI_002324 [Neolecta irregularis DAH-3]|eukprot:OLL26487.1 hypothetical protein NEOLI_002324 [Neolecta irregularis DAH-3]